jgi:hypothetical protein
VDCPRFGRVGVVEFRVADDPRPQTGGDRMRIGVLAAVLAVAFMLSPVAQGQPQPEESSATPQDYRGSLRKMEEEIVDLKERVYNTKTRLVLLKERILADVVSGAYAVIVHRNDMGSAFTLEQMHYHIDGKSKLFMINKDGNLDTNKEFVIHSGAISPGNHVINVEMVYRGKGKVLTYMKGYQFKITSRHVFYATEGRIIKILSSGYERGDITYSVEERPSIKFKVDLFQFSAENLAKLTGKKKVDKE